jgi:DNA-binding response OmpR family regulator
VRHVNSLAMRILLIEDDEKVARAVSTGLQAERLAVDRVSDGLAGLDAARLVPYDLVILDLMLPGLGGADVLKRLREVNSHVPVLILTARDAMSDKITNFEAGADDYLTKPFAFAELVVRVKALLRRGGTKRANVIHIGDLEIDCVHHQVRRNGTSIKLTTKEYALLEYLGVNAGRVLSRSMIVDHVWDQSFEGLTNIVDVYVRQLRSKIDEPFSLPLIRTVRGQGYYMSEKEL